MWRLAAAPGRTGRPANDLGRWRAKPGVWCERSTPPTAPSTGVKSVDDRSTTPTKPNVTRTTASSPPRCEPRSRRVEAASPDHPETDGELDDRRLGTGAGPSSVVAHRTPKRNAVRRPTNTSADTESGVGAYSGRSINATEKRRGFTADVAGSRQAGHRLRKNHSKREQLEPVVSTRITGNGRDLT